MARLTPITSKDQVPAKDHAIVDGIVKSRGALQGPFTMFLHSPELAGRLAHLGAFVRFEGSLDMRVRVLAALTVARELEAVYVWGAQTGQARKLGVPESTITAVRDKHARVLAPEDEQIVEFTRDLLRKHRVDDATVQALRARFGDDGFIQLTGTIGYYSMLAMTVNACELEAAPGAEVLKAQEATGAPSYSGEAYPFRDIHDKLRRIFDAFGPARMFWGTDITRMPCSYRQCVTMFTETLPWLKGRDQELVMGGAVCDWLGWKPPQ